MQDMDYVQSKGDDLYRRSLYTFWKRTIAPPMMANFDAATRESCVVRETRTNTPLQALDLMNDVTFVEAARFLGQRMIKEGGADADARLRYGFRLVTGPRASAAEEQVLRDNLQFHLDYFAGKAEETKPFLASRASLPAIRPSTGAELAAYASVGSLLLNLDETRDEGMNEPDRRTPTLHHAQAFFQPRRHRTSAAPRSPRCSAADAASRRRPARPAPLPP